MSELARSLALPAIVIGSLATLQVRAASIGGTGWIGTNGSNWSTNANWDNTPPSSDERNLFFGQAYFNAGNSGSTTANNDLSWNGYRVTFQDIISQPDVSFTITGNGFTLFDFGGSFPKIENLSNVTQTFTLTSGQTITLQGGGAGKAEINPINGDIVFTVGTKVQLNSPLDIFGNFNKTLIFNDVVSGGSGNPLTLQQNSNVVLNAANTYAGNTNIKAGTVYVGAHAPNGGPGALGNTTNSVNLGDTGGAANASLYTNGAFTVGRNIEVRSGNTGTITIGGNTADASTYSGNINLGTASGTAKSVTLVAASGGSVDFSGVVNENTSVPNSNVTIGSATHTGTVRLSNGFNNQYGGVTTINNGAVLEVTRLANGGSNSSIGNSSNAASNLVIDGGTLRLVPGSFGSTNRLFTFTSNGATLEANSSMNFNQNLLSLVAAGTGNRTLTLTGTNIGIMSPIIPDPSSGMTAVTKSGTGTWLLIGASTYSGGTNVNQGTLDASNSTGSATGTGPVTVANGATLAGTGSISGAVTVNGTLSPDSSINIETLDTGALTFGANSTFDYTINTFGANADLVNAAGNLSINSLATLSLTDISLPTLLAMGTKFTLINYSGTWDGGTFAGLPNYYPNLVIGLNRFQIRYDDISGGSNFGGGSLGGGTSYVTITAVPELSSFFTVGLGSIFALAIVSLGRRAGYSLLKI
jgi:fibronectin-binding autotransporter adhesin